MTRNYSYKSYVIGLGRVGFLLEGETGRAVPCTHAGCFEKHPQTNLCGGFDISPQRCMDFEGQFPDRSVSSTGLSHHLGQVKPEIISVCTSSSTHLEVMKTIQEASDGQPWPRGILLEKPVGVTLEEGEEIQKIAEEMKIPVIVCHDRRFYPDFQAFKQLISRGGLGKLRQINGSVYCSSYVRGRSRSRKNLFFGGPLIHDGTHLFDLMIYYAGLPTHVSGISLRHQKNTRTEDTSLGTLIFPDGVTGRFFVGGKRKYFHFEMEWEWERAKLSYSHGRIEFLKKNPNSPYLKKAKIPHYPQENPYMNRLSHLIEVMEGKSNNQSSIEDGLLALRTIEAVYRSCKRHGELISLYNGKDFPDQVFQTQEVESCMS